MSQQPAVKMSAAPLTAEALESAAGMLEGRQRKLESMIRDPRSPVNVESLLHRSHRSPSRLVVTACPFPKYLPLCAPPGSRHPTPQPPAKPSPGRAEVCCARWK